ncbi:hypothetical protein HDA30_001895 [Micrococcus cohnii]|uniref:DUF8083 domain-containing protein n=1 Tax=Micrococcus cohnii TaxID=993416 RepID=A0A7W7GQE2_9MICC|nr:hypothetical protein [Micrococcus cohnii]MBB4736387.1 hypothetical protein [Micrococcus cohnii]
MTLDAVAHLRVFEPADAFGERLQTRLAWAAALKRDDLDRQADARTLERVTRRSADPFPPTGQPDLIRVLHGYDGGPHFCPDQLADRAAWAALELKELLEPEVFDALVPADAIARNERARGVGEASVVADGAAGERLRTRASSWSLPHSWALLFDPEEQPGPVADGESARRTVPLPSALAQLWKAEKILAETAAGSDLAQEVTELVGWLQGFGRDAILEVDYGRLTRWVWPDETPFDVWTLVDSLDTGDDATAAVALDRLHRRWGEVGMRARAS